MAEENTGRPKETDVAAVLEEGAKDIRAEPLAGDGGNAGRKEEAQIEVDRDKANAQEHARLVNLDLQKDIDAREKYANRIFCLIVGWVVALLAVVFLQGFLSKREISLSFSIFGSPWKTAVHFELSDPVLIALIGGATASVFGFFVAVAKYLFPERKFP